MIVLRAVAIGLLTALLQAPATAVPERYVDHHGVVRFYCCGPLHPALQCQPGTFCDIELSPTEGLFVHPVADQSEWQIEATQGYGAHILFEPIRVGARTMLWIHTTQHDYYVWLEGVARTEHAVYGFSYPPAPPPPLPAPVPTPTPSPTPAPLRGAYKVTGSAPFAPTRVANDGTRTYVFLPRLAEYPVLLALDRSGTTATVNYAIHDGADGGRTYIVPGLVDRMVLVIGTGKSTEEVRIEHE